MKLLGVALLALALVVAILPQYGTCASEGKFITLASGKTIPMKCSWTAKGELALAVPLMGVGALMAVSGRKETKRSLALLGIILGIFVILLPTELIGVCTSMTALCGTLMKPALLGLGSLIIAASLVGLVVSQLSKEKQP